MPQSPKIQPKARQIMMVKKRQTRWIAPFYGKRIDSEISRMPMAECDISAINTYTFHSLKKTLLVVSPEKERQDIAGQHLYRKLVNTYTV